jgi:hypothetical protein
MRGRKPEITTNQGFLAAEKPQIWMISEAKK